MANGAGGRFVLGGAPGVLPGPLSQEGDGLGKGQGADVQAPAGDVAQGAGGDEDGAVGAGDAEDGRQVVRCLGAVEQEEQAAVGQGALGSGGRVGPGVVAQGAGDVFQGHGCVGAVVEVVVEDAVGEVGRRLLQRGEAGQGFGGERRLADAAGAVEGGAAAGAQGAQQLIQVLLAAGEVFGRGRALEGNGGRGGRAGRVVVDAGGGSVQVLDVHVHVDVDGLGWGRFGLWVVAGGREEGGCGVPVEVEGLGQVAGGAGRGSAGGALVGADGGGAEAGFFGEFGCGESGRRAMGF